MGQICAGQIGGKSMLLLQIGVISPLTQRHTQSAWASVVARNDPETINPNITMYFSFISNGSKLLVSTSPHLH